MSFDALPGPDHSDRLRELFGSTRRIARKYFYAPDQAAESKGDGLFDPVTAADREIETMLRAGLSASWPGDRIVGEEAGSSGPDSAERTWYIDPIDGTKAFVTGMVGWGTLVGLVSGGRAVAGWLDQPILGETYWAVAGRARVRRHVAPGSSDPIAAGKVETHNLGVSGQTELDQAICYTTHPSMFDGGPHADGFAELCRRVRMQRFGGDCYSYAMLAAGRVDLVVEADLKPYDIVALIPIVEAAGGVLQGPDGTPPLDGGTVVAAASAELADAAWKVLSGR